MNFTIKITFNILWFLTFQRKYASPESHHTDPWKKKKTSQLYSVLSGQYQWNLPHLLSMMFSNPKSITGEWLEAQVLEHNDFSLQQMTSVICGIFHTVWVSFPYGNKEIGIMCLPSRNTVQWLKTYLVCKGHWVQYLEPHTKQIFKTKTLCLSWGED
jgi:hypothetical protein